MARVAHVILMVWLTLTFVFSWLPLVRSLMDGPSYQWGKVWFGRQFGGAGAAGDLWLLVLEVGLGLALLVLGWRRPGLAFRTLATGWLALLLANTLHTVVADPGAMSFQGATLGLEISTIVLRPTLDGLALMLALAWALKWGKAARPAAVWGRLNSGLLLLALLLAPLQYGLLRTGQGQEFNDVVGVLLTIGQWLLISVALVPWARPRPVAVGAPA